MKTKLYLSAVLAAMLGMSICNTSCSKDDDAEEPSVINNNNNGNGIYEQMNLKMKDSIGVSINKTLTMTPIERPDSIEATKYGFEMWYQSNNATADLDSVANMYFKQLKDAKFTPIQLKLTGSSYQKPSINAPLKYSTTERYMHFAATSGDVWDINVKMIDDKYIRVCVFLYAYKTSLGGMLWYKQKMY